MAKPSEYLAWICQWQNAEAAAYSAWKEVNRLSARVAELEVREDDMDENTQAQGSELMQGLGEVRLTRRGFQYVEFLDRDNESCSLQQSSLADFDPSGTSAVWLGAEECRMHLDLDRVKKLIQHLQKWVDDGMLA